MFRVLKWATPLVAFAMLLSLSAVTKAEDTKKDTGTVKGTVVDKDGKPVAGAEVMIFTPMKHADHTKPEAKAADPSKAKGDKPVSVVPAVKSDDKGEFTLADVPAGDYTVVARLKGQGSAREKVTVKSGETATVELKLAPHGAKPTGDKPAEKIAK
jgi:hypothetical protein